jgi:hypothetical protein
VVLVAASLTGTATGMLVAASHTPARRQALAVHETVRWHAHTHAGSRICCSYDRVKDADVGEPGRNACTESERQLYREEAYQDIVENVDRLVSDIEAISQFSGSIL